jgi:hypothetical protein
VAGDLTYVDDVVQARRRQMGGRGENGGSQLLVMVRDSLQRGDGWLLCDHHKEGMDGCFVITIKRGWVGELLEHVFLAYGHLNDSFSGYW